MCISVDNEWTETLRLSTTSPSLCQGHTHTRTHTHTHTLLPLSLSLQCWNIDRAGVEAANSLAISHGRTPSHIDISYTHWRNHTEVHIEYAIEPL